jgi:hypothetical protein
MIKYASQVIIELPRQRVIELFDSIENMYKWQTVSIFRFRGIMAFMAPFMKPAFMQNTILMMERFKLFAGGR